MPTHTLDNLVTMAIPMVSTVVLGAIVAIAIWAGQRRRERELHYRYELLKRFLDKGADREDIAQLMREQSSNVWRGRREALKVAGIITLLGGIGTMYGMSFIDDEAIWRIGAIPTLIGAGLLLYALIMAPRNSIG